MPDAKTIAAWLSEEERGFLCTLAYATQRMLNQGLVVVFQGKYRITPLGVAVREILKGGA